MANKVTMNEAQLRDKVYKMVCESFETLMAEGKTFKDQKSWNKKGFQKSNKFQKNDKYQNWKNGGNMSSDQDECMKESEDKGYEVIDKGDGMFPKKVKLSGKDGRDGFEKLCKSKQFIKPNSETDECMNEGQSDDALKVRVIGAINNLVEDHGLQNVIVKLGDKLGWSNLFRAIYTEFSGYDDNYVRAQEMRGPMGY